MILLGHHNHLFALVPPSGQSNTAHLPPSSRVKTLDCSERYSGHGFLFGEDINALARLHTNEIVGREDDFLSHFSSTSLPIAGHFLSLLSLPAFLLYSSVRSSVQQEQL